jgi:hypothetical protein
MSYAEFLPRKLSEIEDLQEGEERTPITVGRTVLITDHRLYSGMNGKVTAEPHLAIPGMWEVELTDVRVRIREQNLTVVG